MPVFLYAGGQKEDVALTARELMDQRKWDEAIIVIKNMMISEPRRFDEGQLLIQEIMINKRIYNDYFQKLVDAYLNGDLELAYQIIGEMEAQDPSPNPRTKELIVEARSTAGVIATKNRFDALMAEAKIAIDEKRYDDAIDIYLSGSDIARDLFGDLALGNIVENQVDSQNRHVAELAASFKGMGEEVAALEQSAQAARLSQNPSDTEIERVRQNIVSVNERITGILDVYADLVNTSIGFLAYHDQLQEANNLEKDIYHLKYIAYLYTGRPSSEEFEGISGVIDIITSSIIDPLEMNLYETVNSVYADGVSAFDEDRFIDADRNFQRLASILDMYFDTLYGWSARAIVDPMDGSIWRERLRGYAELTPRIAFVQSLEEILSLYRDASGIGERYATILAARQSTVGEYRDSRERLSELKNEMEGIFPDSTIPRLSPLFDDEKIAGAVQGFLAEKDRMLDRLTRTDIQYENERIKLVIEDFSDRAASANAVVEDSAAKIAGYQETEDEGGVFIRDPRTAKEQLTAQKAENAGIVNEIRSEIARIGTNPDYVTGSQEIIDDIGTLSAISESLSGMDGDIDGNIAQADDYLFQAQRYTQEGDDYFQEAKTLMEREEYDRAKQRVEDVASRYDEALSFQDDPVIRNRRDNEIPALYDEIIARQKQSIVREVRTLINQGRTNYSQGDFVAAESVLLRAQARYSEVSVDPEPEVEYWLTLAQTALSINSGREILPVDPLYPEMTQLLNLAKADYNSAKDAIANGNRTRANNLLDQAEVRIQTVQQPFPQNQDASLLFLKILQLRDPGQFDTIFAERFTNAMAKLRSNPQEGYIELMDLQVLKPDYRGMKDAIYQAEIATGIRVPPPDTTKLRRAEELYKQALNIVRGNVTAQFPIALSALNEAIRLNPDYIDAVRLKDRIQSSGTGIAGATAILSAKDQVQYEEAVNAYQNGLYREAQLIVDRLLLNKDNQRNTRLLDLKERIQSKL